MKPRAALRQKDKDERQEEIEEKAKRRDEEKTSGAHLSPAKRNKSNRGKNKWI